MREMTQKTEHYFNLKEGQLVLFSIGEYSDYMAEGLFQALRDFSLKNVYDTFVANEVTKEWVESKYITKGGYWKTNNTYQHFISYLMREGFINTYDYTEIHLGDYGDIDFSRYV